MAVSVVNSSYNDTSPTTAPSITFGFTPSANNILVAFIQDPAGTTNPGLPSGWTALLDHDVSNLFGRYFYKISDGTETSLSWSSLSNTRYTMGVVELTGNATASPIDGTNEDESKLSTDATSTGSGSVTPTGDGYALAMFYVHAINKVTDGTEAWTNSFAQIGTESRNQTWAPWGSFAGKAFTGTSAQSTTFSFSGTAARVYGGLAIIKEAASGTTHEGSITVGVSAGTSDSATMTRAGSISLGLSHGTSDSTNWVANGAINIGLSHGTGDSPTVQYETAVSLGVVNGLAGAGANITSGDITLGVSAGLADDAIVTINGDITLGVSHGLSDSVLIDYEGPVTLGVSQGLGASVLTDYQGAVTFDVQLGTSSSALGVFAGTLTLGVSAGLASAGEIATSTHEVTIALGLSHGLSDATATDYGASLALGVQAGLSGSTLGTFNAAVSLGLSIGHAMAAVIGQPITAARRTLTVRAEGRVLTITVEGRQITVRAEDRTLQ